MNIALINASVMEYVCPSDPEDTASFSGNIVELRHYGGHYGYAVRLCGGRHEEFYLIRYRNKDGKDELGICACGRNTTDLENANEFIRTTDILQEPLWKRYGLNQQVINSFQEWRNHMPVPPMGQTN